MSGFHLGEVVDFLRRSQLLEESCTNCLQEGLLAGLSLSQLFDTLRFSDAIVTQLSLSEIHGNTVLSLAKIQDYLVNITTVRKKLVEVATYPLILLVFLILMMLGLKNYLLPQLDDQNIATLLIQHLPMISVLTMGSVLLIIVVGRWWYCRTSKLQVYTQLVRIPYIGTIIQTYLTAYYAREWGHLIGQGFDMIQIVTLMQTQPSILFSEIGEDLNQSFNAGLAFHEKIARYPFFKRELSLMIEYGDAKSKLGQELEIYAKECWEAFFRHLHKSMQWIQPLVFLFVAVMIVLIYAAMLLPIYHNMEM